MSEHVLDGQASTADPWAAKTPVEGFMNLTLAIGGHLSAVEELERTFLGTMLEASQPEGRKEAVLEHVNELKDGIKELFFHKDRLAVLLGVELHPFPFEREL